MTERRRSGRRAGRAVTIAALVVNLLGSIGSARAASICLGGSHCDGFATAAADKGTRANDDFLDKIGLGSLKALPWETLPAALALSALVGAGGGFVYSGLASTRNDREDGASRS